MTGDRRAQSRLLAAAFVILVVLSGAAALSIASAQKPTDTGVGRANATFNQSVISEERGGIAAVELRLSGTPNATVTVGSNAVNYETHVTVNDSNGDGNVTVLVNTFIAGRTENESAVYDTAAETDDVIRVNRTTGRLNAPLDTSTYNLSVAVSGHRTDTATLELTERTTGELVTWTAPAASFDNVTNASEVATAIETGRITTTDTVAAGDVLVLQFKLSGIYGALEASNFTRLVERGAIDLSIVQTNPGTNRPPKRLKLERSLANGSIRVIPDEQNDVLYINVNTSTAVFENGTPAAGDEFESTLTVNGESDLAARDRSISANVTVVGAELSFGTVTLASGPNQTVTGTTSVAPGSEVTVRLQNNRSGSFLKTNTTTVKSNGTFTAEFNLSEVAPNTTVRVRADGPLGTSDRTNTTVQPNLSNEAVIGTASLTVTDQQSTGKTVTVQNVTLPAGGFVVVHAPNVSSVPVKSVLGASSYLNGTVQNVEVSLDNPLTEDTRVVVMVHKDTNDNQVYDFSSSNGSEDVPYTASGNPVGASARITVTNATSATLSGSETTTHTLRGTNTMSTTSENGPGFGLVFAAVALVLAVLAATFVRRG